MPSTEARGNTAPVTTWGRTKLGRHHAPALSVAIPLGIAIAALSAVVAVALDAAGPRPVLGGVIFTLCLSGPAIGLAYVTIVDRSTIRGAAERPEESIESRWYSKAASGTLADVVVIAGLGSAVVTFLETNINDGLLLGGVVAVAFVSFTLRYLITRSRG